MPAPEPVRDQIGDVPRSFTAPTVGIVVPCMNEGPDLEATVAMLAAGRRKPDEVVVVDDGSRESVVDRMEPFRRFLNLRVIVNDRRRGSGWAKHTGLASCTSDLLVVMDSHMRPPWDWLDIALDGFLQWPYAVMCSRSRGFESNSTFVGGGCRFVLDEHGWWDAVWNEPPAMDHGSLIGCIHGGCYAMGRKLLEHLGGYAPGHVGWGYEEQPLCLRAWAAGFECRLLGFDVPHNYQRGAVDRRDATGRDMDPWEVWTNRHLCMASLFESGRYENVYGPVMRDHFWPAGLRDAVAAMSGAIHARRVRLADIRRRSDQDVARILCLRHPESIDEYRDLERVYGRKK